MYNARSHSKHVLSRSWPLERATVKSKYSNWNALSDGNYNACPICRHFQSIRSRNCAWSSLSPMECIYVQCTYINRKPIHDSVWWQLLFFPYRSPFQSYLEWAKVKCKYTNRKPIHDLLFDGNSNFNPIYHHFQDIHCRNVHDLDLDL